MSIAARPAMAHHFTADEDGQKMRIYLTKACRTCPLKDQCTPANERRIKRWEHEHVVEAAQTRLDQNPQAMRVRRETVEHPFATLKLRMGAAHFLMKTLPKVATEMALHVSVFSAPFKAARWGSVATSMIANIGRMRAISNDERRDIRSR